MDRELLWVAIAGYAAAAVLAGRAFQRGEVPGRAFGAALVGALLVHAVSIGVRWERLGHGPFVTMHETLSSNLLSLLGLYGLAWLAIPALRPVTALAFPVPLVMAAWVMDTNPAPGHLPPTYHTTLLYLHVSTGKVFLAATLAAMSLGHAVLLRRAGARLAFVPPDAVLEAWAHRLLGVAFVFDTAMLVLGALWAQDAWGRYWGWDPLETWSFLTWAALGICLHARSLAGRQPALQAVLATAVFVVAFFTFFGVPFVTIAQHRGAI